MSLAPLTEVEIASIEGLVLELKKNAGSLPAYKLDIPFADYVPFSRIYGYRLPNDVLTIRFEEYFVYAAGRAGVFVPDLHQGLVKKAMEREGLVLDPVKRTPPLDNDMRQLANALFAWLKSKDDAINPKRAEGIVILETFFHFCIGRKDLETTQDKEGVFWLSRNEKKSRNGQWPPFKVRVTIDTLETILGIPLERPQLKPGEHMCGAVLNVIDPEATRAAVDKAAKAIIDGNRAALALIEEKLVPLDALQKRLAEMDTELSLWAEKIITDVTAIVALEVGKLRNDLVTIMQAAREPVSKEVEREAPLIHTAASLTVVGSAAAERRHPAMDVDLLRTIVRQSSGGMCKRRGCPSIHASSGLSPWRPAAPITKPVDLSGGLADESAHQLAQGLDSLRMSMEWFDHTPRQDWYLAVQDGQTVFDVPWKSGIAGIFIGGSTQWKWDSMPLWVRFAQRHGLPVHVGRISSPSRLRLARAMGVTSGDSAQPLWSSKKLEAFLAECDQATLFGGEVRVEGTGHGSAVTEMAWKK